MNSILVLVCTLTMANGQTTTTTSPRFYSERACATQWDRHDRDHCQCLTIKENWERTKK